MNRSIDAETSRRLTKLQRSQRGIPPRYRVWYSKLEDRFFRWHQIASHHWQMRDVKTGEIFGYRFESIEFTDDGYRAKRSGRSLRGSWDRTHTNSASEYKVVTGNKRGTTPDIKINFDTVDIPDGFRAWDGPIVAEAVADAQSRARAVNKSLASGGWVRGFTRNEEAVTGRFPSKESPMTPLKLSILFWRAAHSEANYCHPDGVIPQGYIRNALEELRHDGLVTTHATGYRLTSKANVLVEHMLKQPLPEQLPPQWTMPAAIKPF